MRGRIRREDEVGLLLLAADGTVEMANRAGDRWLDELGDLVARLFFDHYVPRLTTGST